MIAQAHKDTVSPLVVLRAVFARQAAPDRASYKGL